MDPYEMDGGVTCIMGGCYHREASPGKTRRQAMLDFLFDVVEIAKP
jgi:hypothetical protein